MSFPGHYEVEERSLAGPSSQPLHTLTGRRRPWSPFNYDDGPAPQAMYDTFASHRQSIPGPGLSRTRRQEASEDSIEALDLADYARTLRRPEAAQDSPYPPFPFTSHVHPFSSPTPQRVMPNPPFSSYPEYPPSPPPIRPFSVSSRDTYMQPPSLVSGESSYETHESNVSRSFPTQRPYSMPPFLAPVLAEHLPHRGPAIFSPSAGPMGDRSIRYASPAFEDPEYGDISKFPEYTRHWFGSPSSKSKHSSMPAISSDISYRPLSDRFPNALPWSSKDSEVGGPPLDESIKEERMRMLEREFGKKSTYEAEDVPLNGSVDEKGNLITSGPKKRAATRWAQGILELTAVISSIYGALVIKTKVPAPPAGKPQAYVLYAASIISFLLTFYLFAIRPCCCGRRKKPNDPGQSMPGGLMVLPVQGGPNGKKPKKKGKKGKAAQAGGGDVQVNLIVDPGMFHGREEEPSGDEDEFDGSQYSSRPKRRARRPRKSIFEGLAMEKAWEEARSFLKRMFAIDIVCCLVWGAVFVFILLGHKCPPGQFNGWCDSYNVAIACACFLCLAFGLSVFFDISDLHASRTSPRTRT